MNCFYEELDKSIMLLLREILCKVEKEGLNGKEHFCLICHAPLLQGLPDFIEQKYFQQITLILEHDFRNLKVNDDSLSVELSFSGDYYTIMIPFAAILSIVDPSTNFAMCMPDRSSIKSNVISFDSVSAQ